MCHFVTKYDALTFSAFLDVRSFISREHTHGVGPVGLFEGPSGHHVMHHVETRKLKMSKICYDNKKGLKIIFSCWCDDNVFKSTLSAMQTRRIVCGGISYHFETVSDAMYLKIGKKLQRKLKLRNRARMTGQDLLLCY